MFKKICLIIAILSIPSLIFAASWTRNIHAEWEPYSPPDDIVVTGFRLYQNGEKVCDFLGSSLVSGDCEVTLSRKITNFTLSALINDGTETPQSEVYGFIDWGNRIKIKQIINN